jgi:4-hydroxy-tetrahydrodipicolinate synthase
MSHPLAGIYAASLTPLHPEGAPDLDVLPAYLDFLARRGCHGALLFGTTGEGPSFSFSERLEVIRRATEIRAIHPHFNLLAGTGTPSLTETINLNKAAFDLGYSGVVCLPPYYYRKAGDDGLFEWFSQVISKSVPSNGFLMGYHFPAMAGVGFSIQLLAKLKDAFPTQFAGIKDSSHDQYLPVHLSDLFGDDLLVLTGTDSYLQHSLDHDGGGCITAPANLMSPLLRQVWDVHKRGEDPSVPQQTVSRLRNTLDKYSPFPPTLKAMVARLYNFPRWPVRPPLEELSPVHEEQAVYELGEIMDLSQLA